MIRQLLKGTHRTPWKLVLAALRCAKLRCAGQRCAALRRALPCPQAYRGGGRYAASESSGEWETESDDYTDFSDDEEYYERQRVGGQLGVLRLTATLQRQRAGVHLGV